MYISLRFRSTLSQRRNWRKRAGVKARPSPPSPPPPSEGRKEIRREEDDDLDVQMRRGADQVCTFRKRNKLFVVSSTYLDADFQNIISFISKRQSRERWDFLEKIIVFLQQINIKQKSLPRS